MIKIKVSHWFNSPKKWASWMLGLVILLTGYFLILDRYAPSTDDAVIQAYVLNIASYDSGKIKFLNIKNNSFVRQGDVLFQLDPAAYLLDLNQARAGLVLAQEQAREYFEGVLMAQAKVSQAEADLAYQDSHFKALQTLVAQGAISQDNFNRAKNLDVLAQQNLISAQQNLIAARALLGPDVPVESKDYKNLMNIHIFKAQMLLNQAQLAYERVVVKAPFDAWVSNLQVQEGAYISTGGQALSLIKNSFWVQANFKENDLQRIQPGQKVWVTINNYPGQIFEGEVESLGLGVSTDSDGRGVLLPSIDKTNNWVNLAQRFPVRIKIINLPKNYVLRVGATSIVTVFTSKIFLINSFAKLNQWIRAMAQYIY